jgi:hypothetical protein
VVKLSRQVGQVREADVAERVQSLVRPLVQAQAANATTTGDTERVQPAGAKAASGTGAEFYLPACAHGRVSQLCSPPRQKYGLDRGHRVPSLSGGPLGLETGDGGAMGLRQAIRNEAGGAEACEHLPGAFGEGPQAAEAVDRGVAI